MPEDSRFGVFEMGMNHPGEIEPLSRLARPHAALVTTVEAVHGAFFASTDEIADAKAEIFAGMEAGGAAVLNRDNPYFGRLKAAAEARGIKNVLGFGVARGIGGAARRVGYRSPSSLIWWPMWRAAGCPTASVSRAVIGQSTAWAC